MKLIQPHGQPNYGRFSEAPEEINLQDYHNSFLSNPFKQKLRYKKFSFVAIQHDQFSIGIAVADLAWVGHGFYYCHDRTTEKSDDFHALQPVSLATQVQEATRHNQFNCFKSRNIEIYSRQNKKSRAITVLRQGNILCQAEIDCRQRQPLYMCSPTGVRGWTYTHKSMALPVQGYVNFQGEKLEFNSQTLASLDDSCGYLRPETEWFWLSCQTWLEGKTVAINLASGVNESVGNENCLWINGILHALDDVIFERINARTWHIFSLNQQVELTVYTTWRRYEKINAGIMASEFSQWMAVINGYITVDGQRQNFNTVAALLEEHYARW